MDSNSTINAVNIYVFNPDSDMALADNRVNYIAPASICQMMNDLAILPIWYAEPCSRVLAALDYNEDFLNRMKVLFPIETQLVDIRELINFSQSTIIPWGWNPAFCERMLRAGVSSDRLLAKEDLMEYRNMSSREFSANFPFLIKEDNTIKHICGTRTLISQDENNSGFSISNLPEEIRKNGFVFKSPWSSSGRGLRWCFNETTKSTIDWCNKELKKHGTIIVEPVYDKVGDFALEYYMDTDGAVSFGGYSHFLTNDKGAYRCSVLTSNEEIEKWILQYIPLEEFARIRERVQLVLQEHYSSTIATPLGVDMMICRDANGCKYAVHPCVEVNVRMTMGIVARRFYDRFVSPDSKGEFSIDSYPNAEALMEQHKHDEKDRPLVVKDGRVVSGYLPLTPITPTSKYRAFVRIEER